MNQTYCRVGVTLCSVVIAGPQDAVTGTTQYSTVQYSTLSGTSIYHFMAVFLLVAILLVFRL